jgi:hypothetical protein
MQIPRGNDLGLKQRSLETCRVGKSQHARDFPKFLYQVKQHLHSRRQIKDAADLSFPLERILDAVILSVALERVFVFE